MCPINSIKYHSFKHCLIMLRGSYTLILIMKCSHCGYENPSNANFCLNCGAPLKHVVIPEKRNVTVLFADLVNFTRISENKDPEDVLNMLNAIFEVFEQIVYKYDGTVDKYLGDGIMVLFGAPVAHEDDIERAVRCGAEILASVEEIRENLSEEIHVKVSLNTGYVISGYTGGTKKQMYTVIGDTVNVAEKINEIAEPDTVVLTEKIAEYTSNSFDFKRLGYFTIPGREEPIMLYQYIGTKSSEYGPSTIKGKLVPLVGRKKELETLINLLNSSVQGSGKIITLIGEAGVGKSRMKFEIKNYCKENLDLTVLEADCKSQNRDAVYAPFIEILNSFFGVAHGDDRESRTQKVSKLLQEIQLDDEKCSVLRNFLGIETEVKPKEKIEVFNAICDTIRLASRKKPIFIIIEDAHWIDDASVDLLKFLSEKVKEMNVFILITYRPSHRVSLLDLPYLETLYVTNLSRDDSGELIKNLLGVREVPREFLDLIYKRTEGNPLFIEELTERLYKEGFFEIKNGTLKLLKNLDTASIPDKITNLFLQEIDKLPPDTKQVAKVASVIGREFQKSILLEVIKIENIDQHLKKLEESGLAFADRAREDQYIFKHSFVRDAAYSLLPKREQKELHSKIGEAIEKIYENRIQEFFETLAYHFEIGEDFLKAFVYSYKSGINLLNIGMYAASRSKLRKAEELLEKMPKSELDKVSQEDLYQLYFATSKVLYKTGHLTESLSKIEQALAIAKNKDDTIKIRECLRLKLEVNYTIGDLDSVSGDLESFSKFIDRNLYETLRTKVQVEKGKIDPEKESIDEISKKIKHANPLEATELISAYLDIFNTSGLKEFSDALLEITEGLEKKVGENLLEDFKLQKIKSFIAAKRIERASKELEALRALIKKEYNEEKYAHLLIFDSIIKREQGEFAEAQQLLNFARSVAEEIPSLYIKGVSLFELGRLSLNYSGERLSSITHFNNALETFQTTGEKRYTEQCKIFLWQANLSLGNTLFFEDLPNSVKPRDSSDFFKNRNSIEALTALTHLVAGSIEEAFNRLQKLNHFFVDSETLILIAYFLLLLSFYLDSRAFEEYLNKVNFVLSNRLDGILEFSHFHTISLLQSVLSNNNERGIYIVKQKGYNTRVRALRESSIVFEIGRTVFDPEIDNVDKSIAIEEGLTQVEILRFAVLGVILRTIQYKLIDPSEKDLKSSKFLQLCEVLQKFKYENVLKAAQNLNKG